MAEEEQPFEVKAFVAPPIEPPTPVIVLNPQIEPDVTRLDIEGFGRTEDEKGKIKEFDEARFTLFVNKMRKIIGNVAGEEGEEQGETGLRLKTVQLTVAMDIEGGFNIVAFAAKAGLSGGITLVFERS